MAAVCEILLIVQYSPMCRLEARVSGEVASYALSPESAARQMPHLQAPMLSVDNMEPATVGMDFIFAGS